MITYALSTYVITIASKLNSGIDDLDLNLEDFRQRVNSDLVGKLVNIASRCASFISKNFKGQMAESLAEPELYQSFSDASESIANAYEKREYSRAMREIMALADKANQYIDEKKPWELIKDPEQHAAVQAICSQGLNMFRALLIYLKPVLPQVAIDAEAFLQVSPLSWADVQTPLLGHTIDRFKPLMKRIEAPQIEAMIETSKEQAAAAEAQASGPLAANPIAAEIKIDDFQKIDLRIARIVKAQTVEKSNKLLQLTIDLGGETRNIFAGIKGHYEPAQLEGRLTVIVANLAPRKMRFGVSEGMVLAASHDDSGLYLLNPDSGAEPGMRIS